MSRNFIVNASPLVVERGTDDLSTRQVFPDPIPTPQHLPLSFIFAKKGSADRQLVSGSARTQLYGVDTFDPASAYFNHSTLFSNAVNAEGNVQMHQRIIPADANPEASIRLYLEVIVSAVPVVIRDEAGAPTLDANGDTQPTGATVLGHKLRLVRETIPAGTPIVIGGGITKAGVMANVEDLAVTLPPKAEAPQTAEVGVEVSTLYPFMDIQASSQGVFGNNSGIRLFPTTGDDVPEDFLTETRSYPYLISSVSRKDVNSSPVVNKNLFGEESTMVILTEKGVSPYTQAPAALDDLFPGLFENTDDVSLPLSYSDFGDVHVYYDNIKTVSDMLMVNEAGWAEPEYAISFDWNSVDYQSVLDNDSLIINLLNNLSSKGNQYFTIDLDLTQAVDAEQTLVIPTSLNTVYMDGGSDGTMDRTSFETAVVLEMDKYLDTESEVQDTAINVESIIYDSGYSQTTKKELISFIAERKDTFVVLSSYDPDGVGANGGSNPMALSDELGAAVELKTRIELYPESSYYGTPVSRGMIVGQSALIRNSLWKKRAPLTYEIAVKSAKYMGAGDQKWSNGSSFDNAPGSIINDMFDLQPAFIPASIKFTLWNTGLVWAQPFDRRSFFFPALQTVYDDETSVLNSYFTALAIGFLNKVSWKAWRNFTGITSVTNAQLAERVNRFVENEIADKFDSKFVIFPETIFTAQDEARGYSWSLVIKLYSPNMKTVMTTSIEVYRLSDLNQ